MTFVKTFKIPRGFSLPEFPHGLVGHVAENNPSDPFTVWQFAANEERTIHKLIDAILKVLPEVEEIV